MRSLRLSAVLAASVLLHVAWGAALWRAGRAAAAPRPVAPVPSASASAPAGESFEIPAERADEPGEPPEPPAAGTASPVPAPAPAPRVVATAAAQPREPRAPRDPSAPPASTRPQSSAGASASVAAAASPAAPSLFGAVGVRYAVDLLKTFTRAMPQVAMQDTQWATLAIGPVGEADVTLELDDAGHLSDRLDFRGAPAPAIRTAVVRAAALIGGHAFVAKSARSHLVIAATITKDTGEDEYHGSRIALSGTGEFVGNVGKAFFALPIGRRIDFTLKLVDASR